MNVIHADLQSRCSAGDGMQYGRGAAALNCVCVQGFSCGALRWKGAETKGSTALTSEVHE